jgi:hypothetical protein
MDNFGIIYSSNSVIKNVHSPFYENLNIFVKNGISAKICVLKRKLALEEFKILIVCALPLRKKILLCTFLEFCAHTMRPP